MELFLLTQVGACERGPRANISRLEQPRFEYLNMNQGGSMLGRFAYLVEMLLTVGLCGMGRIGRFFSTG